MLEGTETGILGATEDGDEVHIALERLIGSHACIVANSGGGKSGLIRRLLETTHGKIQQIVLDGEDEFYTLREQFDYVIAGGDGGDAPATVDNAADLAIGSLTHGFSLICQLNDLGHDGAPDFIGTFLKALVDSPKGLWHPVLVVVDELQRFAPRLGYSGATDGIKALLSRGRKRGFTAIGAGTKLTDIDPSIRGGFNNWMFGRVGQALDRNAAADALGFTPKEGRERLRGIPARKFWGFGPAISDEPVLFRVSDAETTVVRPGDAKIPTPPAPEALRGILAGLAKAEPEPEPALKEAVERLQHDIGVGHEIAGLRRQIDQLEGERDDLKGDVETLTAERDQARGAAEDYKARVYAALRALGVVSMDDLDREEFEAGLKPAKAEVAPGVPSIGRRRTEPGPSFEETKGEIEREIKDALDNGILTLNPTAEAFIAMLDTINPAAVTWAQLCSMTNRKPRGGNFNTARRQIRESGRVIEEGKLLRSAQPPPRGLSRDKAIDIWRTALAPHPRALQMFDVLREAVHPMTKDEIGEAVGIKAVGGNWNTNFAQLRNNNLIEPGEGGGFQLATKLPGER